MARSFGVPIALPADAASSMHAVTKQQMDAADATKAASTHTHAESDVTSLVSDLTLKSPLAAPQFTGVANFGGATTRTVITLTDATTIAVNAALGNFFRVTITANRIMGAPSNPTDGQLILFAIKQDGTGSRTVDWATSTAYVFGTDVPTPVLSTTAQKVDYLGFVYSGTGLKWQCIAVARGY